MAAVNNLTLPTIAVILETQPGRPKMRITPSQNPEGVMSKLLKLPVFRSFASAPMEDLPPPKPARRGILKNRCEQGIKLAQPKAVRFADDSKAFDSPVNRSRSRKRSNSLPARLKTDVKGKDIEPDYAALAKAERRARLAANQAQGSSGATQPLAVPRRRKARTVSFEGVEPTSPKTLKSPKSPSLPSPRSPMKKPRPQHPVYPTNVPRLPRHRKGFQYSYGDAVFNAVPLALSTPVPMQWSGPPSPIDPVPPTSGPEFMAKVQGRLRRAVRELGVDGLDADKLRQLVRDIKYEYGRATRARFEDPTNAKIAERVAYLSLFSQYVKARLQPLIVQV